MNTKEFLLQLTPGKRWRVSKHDDQMWNFGGGTCATLEVYEDIGGRVCFNLWRGRGWNRDHLGEIYIDVDYMCSIGEDPVDRALQWLARISENDKSHGERVASLIERMRALFPKNVKPAAQSEDVEMLLPLDLVPLLLPQLLPGAPIRVGKKSEVYAGHFLAETPARRGAVWIMGGKTPQLSKCSLDIGEPKDACRDGGADLALALGRACGLDATRPIQWVLNGSASRNTLVLSDRSGRTSCWTSQEGFSSPCVAKLGDVDVYGPHADRLALITLAKHLMGVSP